MKISFNTLLLFSYVFLSTLLASAEEFKSDELNYAMLIPSGWAVTFQNSAGFSVASADKREIVTLLIPNEYVTSLSSDSISSMVKGFLAAGCREVSRTNFLIGRVLAYRLAGFVGKKKPSASAFIFQMMLADHRLYCLHGCHFGGDISEDSEIQEAIASFHFLRQPEPPQIFGLGRSNLLSLGALGIIALGILGWKICVRRI